MNSGYILTFESSRFTDGLDMRYESKREIKYESIEVFGMSTWMNGVAIIETGKARKKRKVGKWK